MSAEFSVVPRVDERESILNELEGLAWSLFDELSKGRKRPISHFLCEMGRYLSFHFDSAPSEKLNEDDPDTTMSELFSALKDRDLRDVELAIQSLMSRAGYL